MITEAQRRMFAQMSGKKYPMPRSSVSGGSPGVSSPASPAPHQRLGHIHSTGPYRGYRRFNLTLTVVHPEQRYKFHALSKPESFFEIRPNRYPLQRGAYSVELTYKEYLQALQDVDDPGVNLIAIDPDHKKERHGGAISPGAEVMDYLGGSDAEDQMGAGQGVDVGVIDYPIGSTLAASVFAGRIKAIQGFGVAAYDYPDAHGSEMAALAVPDNAMLVMGSADDYDSNLIAAMYWMVDTVGVDIINMSYGAGDSSTTEHDAIAHARSKGIMLFASRGNESSNAIQYPAGYPEVHAITNYNINTDALAASSSFGDDVWAAAPGEPITLYESDGSTLYLDGTVEGGSGGTSSASALSTRAAADVMGIGKSRDQAEEYLQATARSTGAGSAYEGFGVLQLEPETVGPDHPPIDPGDPALPGDPKCAELLTMLEACVGS